MQDTDRPKERHSDDYGYYTCPACGRVMYIAHPADALLQVEHSCYFCGMEVRFDNDKKQV